MVTLFHNQERVCLETFDLGYILMLYFNEKNQRSPHLTFEGNIQSPSFTKCCYKAMTCLHIREGDKKNNVNCGSFVIYTNHIPFWGFHFFRVSKQISFFFFFPSTEGFYLVSVICLTSTL